MAVWQVGDRVEKKDGYRFPGEVRAVIVKIDGELRYVVECTAPACAGMLHIFKGSQLIRAAPSPESEGK